MRFISSGLIACLVTGSCGAQELHFDLNERSGTWTETQVIADGVVRTAASLADRAARIDLGPCPVSSDESFTLIAHVRTTDGGFSTPLMARDGDRVGLSLVMGRRAGCISFETWSWGSTKLISQMRIDDGKWHRIVAEYDAASNYALLSIDGVHQASGHLGRGSSPTAELRLGNNIGADQPFSGDLDEVSILRHVENPQRFDLLKPVLLDEVRDDQLAILRERLLAHSLPVVDNPDQWGNRKRAVGDDVADALGLAPLPERRPLDFQIHSSIERDELVMHRVSWTTWPEYRATGWLWLRADHDETVGHPAVLCPHGHWAGGAMHPTVQARLAHLAHSGYVVLAVDNVHVEDVATGVNSVGAMTWNNIRAIDYLLSRSDVDADRIGVTGASGGAQQTMYLMALEDRIAAAAPVCMMSYFSEIISDTSAHCGCNHPPRIGFLTDEPEMCAVFAPKPVFFGSVTGDWTHRFPNEGLPEIQGAYQLDNAAEAVFASHLDAGHNYDQPFREAVYELFNGTIGGGDRLTSEITFEPFDMRLMLAMGPRPSVPPDQKTMARDYMSRRAPVMTLADVAPGLSWAVQAVKPGRANWPDGGGAWQTITFTGHDGISVPGVVREAGGASGPWTIVVPEQGKGPFLLDPPGWLDGLERVVIIDPRFRGEWQPYAAAWRRNGLLLGRGEGYQAAHDIALVSRSLAEHGPPTVIGLGEAGVEAILASFVDSGIGSIIAPDIGKLYAEQGNRHPLCPEILRYGDLPRLIDEAAHGRSIHIGGLDLALFDGVSNDSIHTNSRPLDDHAVARVLQVTGTDR